MNPEKTDRRGTPKAAGTVDGKSVGAYGGRIGNPPFEPTDDQRREVRTYSIVLTQAHLAAKMGISEDTLQRHFRKEIDEATAAAVASAGSLLFKAAMNGNMTALIFFLKTRGKWSQRVEVTGADGGPIKHVNLSKALESYSEEQLALLEPIIEQILAAGGADIDFRDQLGSPADQGT